MRILFIPIFIIIIQAVTAVNCNAQKDFKSSTWYTVSGKENFQNPEDFSGQIKVHSTGEKIVIELDIKDDVVKANDNFLNSDKIDFWLSLTSHPEDTSYTISQDTLNDGKREIYFISDPTVDNKNKVCVNFGTVHYTLLPSTSQKIILADKNSYDWIEKSTGEKPGQFEKGIQVKTDITKQGYKLNIGISPLALGFIQLPRMDSLKLYLQITDYDNDNLTSVHSISSENKFIKIDFSKSLNTNVTSVPTYIYDSLRYQPILMFNSKNFWSGISYTETYRNSNETSKKVAIRRSPVGFKKWKTNSIETAKIIRQRHYFLPVGSSLQLTGQTEEFYFLNGKIISSYRPDHSDEWQFKGLAHEFTFQDNSSGIIITQIEDSTCNGARIKSFQIIKVKETKFLELLKIKENSCSNTTSIGSLKIADLKIEKIYWAKEGISLMIEGRIPTKGDMKFRVSFQGDKAIITPVKK